VLTFLAGAGVGVVVARDPAPEVLSGVSGVQTVEVVPSVFDDEITLAVTPILQPEQNLVLTGGGVVTGVECVAGEPITSGSVVVWVDGRPVVGLRLKVPPWRSFTAGIKGADVSALQSALRRLGYEAPKTGTVDYATTTAIRAFWADRDRSNTGEIALEDMVWLPEAELVPSRCPLGLGDQVLAGATVAVIGGGLSRLELDMTPVSVAGDRLAQMEGLETLVPDDGVITDEPFLDGVTGSALFKSWVGDDSGGTLMLSTALADPVEVVRVPPSAVYGVSGGEGCVMGADGPVPVRVVASQLGETFVAPSGGLGLTVVEVPAPEGAGPCT
jgi:hypothetical protein